MLPRFLAATDSAACCFRFAAAADGGQIGERVLFPKVKQPHPTMMPLLHQQSLALLVTPCC